MCRCVCVPSRPSLFFWLFWWESALSGSRGSISSKPTEQNTGDETLPISPPETNRNNCLQGPRWHSEILDESQGQEVASEAGKYIKTACRLSCLTVWVTVYMCTHIHVECTHEYTLRWLEIGQNNIEFKISINRLVRQRNKRCSLVG